MSKTTRTEKKSIEQYGHKGKEQCTNPPVVLVTPETDRDGGKKAYAYDPRTIIDAVRKPYVSALICVHLRLISLTESSRIINAEVL